MKNTNTCPKCGSHDIIKIDGSVRYYGAGNNIMTGLTRLSAVPVNRYVCSECGFSEEWINKEDIPALKKSKFVR
jgi:predicted nucleic-acid-binding Zn-ribbon protein